MESVTIKRLHGMAKVLGSVLGVSGALVFAFVKGPPIKFLHCHPATDKSQNSNSSIQHSSRGDWIKGSLIMLSANTAWCLWLILQVSSSSSSIFYTWNTVQNVSSTRVGGKPRIFACRHDSNELYGVYFAGFLAYKWWFSCYSFYIFCSLLLILMCILF